MIKQLWSIDTVDKIEITAGDKPLKEAVIDSTTEEPIVENGSQSSHLHGFRLHAATMAYEASHPDCKYRN